MKPMSNPVSIPANSALPLSIKYSTYRQEVYRILRNTSVTLPWSIKAGHLSDLSWRMFKSGYHSSFRIRVLDGGLRGYMKTLQKASKGEIYLHRSRDQIREAKEVKNRTDWFRGQENKFQSVLFVPATPGLVLANSIRRIEEQNHQGRRTRIRIVEKSGRTIKDSLAKISSWESVICDADDCFLCTTNPNNKKSCRKPGMGYTITCTLCADGNIVSQYDGETGRCLYTRGLEHIEDLRTGKKTNCLVIHNNTHHGGSKELHFVMKAVGSFLKPMDRQINEALRIKNDKVNVRMNSGSEWRADRIPRAAFIAPGLTQGGGGQAETGGGQRRTEGDQQ